MHKQYMYTMQVAANLQVRARKVTTKHMKISFNSHYSRTSQVIADDQDSLKISVIDFHHFISLVTV